MPSKPECLLDMPPLVIHRDKLLLHHVQLLKAVGVLWVCDISYMLKYLGSINGLTSISVCLCLLLQQQGNGSADRQPSLAWQYAYIDHMDDGPHLVHPGFACMHDRIWVDQSIHWLVATASTRSHNNTK